FRTSHLVSFSVNPSLNGYDRAKTRQFFKSLQSALASLPGVDAASVGRVRLLDGDRSDSTISVEGHRARDGEDMQPWVNTISPGYFATLGVPMLAGREFRPSDERSLIPQAELERIDFNRASDRDRFRVMERQSSGAPKFAG